ncbi:MAG: phytanoyl-CoA dioxygenase family protein [Roseiarcus sp.]|jgi:phytanoyl-CoA hydroxylase
MNWTFRADEMADATEFFRANGFVGFPDLLTAPETAELRDAAEVASYSDDKMANNYDAIFVVPFFERFVRDRRLWGTASALIGRPIELYNSKLNAKPLVSRTGGLVHWHQDYPFHPHTNFDGVVGVIHMDEEGEDAGPLRVIPGSHKLGPVSHSVDGKFCGKCFPSVRDEEIATLTCSAGTVIFHHCLTIHGSGPKTRPGHRRHLIFEFRSQDAVQLGGKVWRSTGLEVMPREVGERVRFPDGTIIEVRADMRLEQLAHGEGRA